MRSDYIADKLEDLRRALVNDFLTEIGINNANLSKRERLNSDEVNANNEEVLALSLVALENMNDGFKRLNELMGGDYMGVKLREYPREEDKADAKNDTLGN